MHKKIIRGKPYYYTSVRENGKIKTIYLGRNPKNAKQKEMEIKLNKTKTKAKKSIVSKIRLLINKSKKKKR